jgi:hypothetical protein
LDAEIMGPAHDRLGRTLVLQVEVRIGLARSTEADLTVCGVERLFLTRLRCTLKLKTFRNSTHGLS